MAFTKRYHPNEIWVQFSFFAQGDGAVANMDESISLSSPYMIDEIRLAFSGVCSNDIYFRLYLDAIESAAYDGYVHSYPLSNSTWYIWRPSQGCPMYNQSGDILQMSCITDNKWGITVLGHIVSNKRS